MITLYFVDSSRECKRYIILVVLLYSLQFVAHTSVRGILREDEAEERNKYILKDSRAFAHVLIFTAVACKVTITHCNIYYLTLSAKHTQTNTCAKSVDPDDTARNLGMKGLTQSESTFDQQN